MAKQHSNLVPTLAREIIKLKQEKLDVELEKAKVQDSLSLALEYIMLLKEQSRLSKVDNDRLHDAVKKMYARGLNLWKIAPDDQQQI